MSGDINFQGTQEEWDALVKRNKEQQTNHIGDANKMVTAVEWLWNEIDNLIPYQDINKAQQFNGLLEQAKAIEKEQIIDAANGYTQTEYLGVSRGEQYYNEKYKK